MSTERVFATSLRRSVIVFLILFAEPSTAQSVDPARYFPLQEGNTWTYFQALTPPGGEIDTLFRGPFTVSGDVTINDTLYVVAPHLFGFTDHLRTDGRGRIYGRIGEHDRLLFDFTK